MMGHCLYFDFQLVQIVGSHADNRQPGKKSEPTELVKLAEAGEEIVLTRFGRDVVRLVPIKATSSAIERRAPMEHARAHGPAHAKPRLVAERSQDFVYDERTGLPK